MGGHMVDASSFLSVLLPLRMLLLLRMPPPCDAQAPPGAPVLPTCGLGEVGCSGKTPSCLCSSFFFASCDDTEGTCSPSFLVPLVICVSLVGVVTFCCMVGACVSCGFAKGCCKRQRYDPLIDSLAQHAGSAGHAANAEDLDRSRECTEPVPAAAIRPTAAIPWKTATAGAPAVAVRAQVGLLSKYVAAEKQIRVGKAADAAHGIQVLMGLTDHAMSQVYADPVGAIRKEFAVSGSVDDKENLRCVMRGIKRAGWTAGVSIEALAAHPHAQLARLQEQHVVALRLYTTSSYCRVNDPLRQVPPQRPHPFPATTFFIDQGIKLMRAVAASLSDAHTTRIFWRGMKDLGLSMEFLQKGGTEFGCLSTSASKEVAVNFAVSELPLVFKFETTDFTSRGADISFLSVYPGEQEALYPPLTFLRSVKTETEVVGGKSMLVATVQPVFM